MQNKKSLLRQLFNGNERARSALLIFGWGFCALMASLFALSSFQYRPPDDLGMDFAQIPLPPAGDVTTTGSIGTQARTGVPSQRFDIFNAAPVSSGGLSNRMDVELETLRREIIALRRSAEAMRHLNEQLSGRVNQLEARSQARTTQPTAGLSRTATTPPNKRPAAVSDSTKNAGNAPRSNFGIDLGRYTSLDDVEKAWKALKETEAAIIGSLEPLASVYQRNDGLTAHLLAGPFSNAADAAKTCARLTQRRISCKPTLYVGQRLAVR